MKKLKSMEEDSVNLSIKLTRMDRGEILEALRVVLCELNETYMMNPAHFSDAKYTWISKMDYESMAIARLNGMIK